MSENRLETLIEASEGMPFGFVVIRSEDGIYRIVHVNSNLVRFFGFTDIEQFNKRTGGLFRNMTEEVDYQRIVEAIENDATNSRGCVNHARLRIMTTDSQEINLEGAWVPVSDSEGKPLYALYLSPTDERGNANIYDQQTGLFTRSYLLDVVEQQATEHTADGKQSTVLYVQIERFRTYNEVYGHDQGNQLLKDVGDLLRETFHSKLMARLYADQFTVFYFGEDARERCERLIERGLSLRPSFPIHLGVGIYYPTDSNIPVARKMDYAKLAYDDAMRTGNGPIGVYSEKLAREQQLDTYIVENIDEALEDGRISAAFQPVVRTSTEEICSFEALARWNDPQYDYISPGKFIPLLEDRRLAYKVDRYMARQACFELRRRIDNNLPVVPISINLSRADFEHVDPVRIVEDALEEYGIDPHLIAIEITETVVMESPEAVRNAIDRFHAKGHEVWMDDFGSAYSSLNVLRSFSFDELKIDMAFMRNLDDKTRHIVTSIVNMAKKLGMRTLAEGVETDSQAGFLRSIGCNRIQGFLYGRPMPADIICDWMRATHSVMETPEAAALHDEGGLTPLDPLDNQALLQDDGARFACLYVNRNMARALKLKDRMAANKTVSRLANGTVSSFGSMLRDAADAAAQSHEEKTFYTTIGTGRYSFTVRTIADNGTERLELLSFEVLADTSSANDASRREMLMRSVSDSFDLVYLVDPTAHTTEVVFSSLAGEQPGDFLNESNFKVFDSVHPDDRIRFLRCFDATFVSDMFERSKSETFSVLIRVNNGAGEYRWREFSFLRIGIGDKGSFLLCGRPYPVVDDDCENVAKAMLSTIDQAEIKVPKSAINKPGSLSGPQAPFPYIEATVLRDSDGTPIDFVYLCVNKAYSDRVNRTPEQLRGKRYLSIFPEGNPHWAAQFGRALSLGHQIRSIMYGTALDAWVECCISPLPGRDRVAVVFVSPNSARSLADQEVISTYRDIPLPVLVVRPKTINGQRDVQYVYVNDEYCRLTGKSRSELQGHGYREMFSVATTEWVDLVCRAAKGERIHERMWGGAQHHWMDVRFAPSSILGCVVMVGVPVDEERDRISELSISQATDGAIIEVARKFIMGRNLSDALDTAIYALGQALQARCTYVISAQGENSKVFFAYEDPRCLSFNFLDRVNRNTARYQTWEDALAQGLTIVSDNIPLNIEGRFKKVELPDDVDWADVNNIMMAPIRKDGKLIAALAAVDSDMQQEINSPAVFETVAPFFQKRFLAWIKTENE